MNALYTPEILTATVGASVTTLTPASKAGTVVIKYLSRSTLSCWVRWDGTNPTASFGDDKWELEPGDSLSLNREEVTDVRVIAAAASAGFLQVLFYPSYGERV